MSQVPVTRLIAPGGRCSTSAPRRPLTRTSCSRSSTSSSGRPSTARCPRRLAALPDRLGRPVRRPGRRSSTRTRPARTRRASRSSARSGWPRSRRSIGLGVETVGTDAGAAHSLRPAVPVPLVRCSARASTGSPSCRTWPGCRPPARCVIAGAAADRRRLGQPVPRAGPGRALPERCVVARGGRPRRSPALGATPCSAWSAAATSTSPTRWSAGGARFVAARHEGGAACMADALGADHRPARRVSPCTRGPGLTNAMTGITEAAKSRTPLLVLAADWPPRRSGPTSASTWPALAAAVGAVAERLLLPRLGRWPTRPGPTAPRVEQRRTVVLACRWTCRPRRARAGGRRRRRR